MYALNVLRKKASDFLKKEFSPAYNILGYKETETEVVFFFGNYYVGLSASKDTANVTTCRLDSLKGFKSTKKTKPEEFMLF